MLSLPDIGELLRNPTIDSAENLNRLNEMQARPVGVPLHQTKSEVENRWEVITPADSLSPDQTWMVMGLAYGLTRMDRSFLEVYSWAGDLSVRAKSHQTDHPLWTLGNLDFRGNRWAHTIQGMNQADFLRFQPYIQSYKIRANHGEFGVEWFSCRMRDPLWKGDPRTVEVWYLLPIDFTRRRRYRLAVQRLDMRVPEVEIYGL